MNRTGHFYALNVLPALAIAVLLLILEHTTLDALVTGWFFDQQSHEFPLRYNAFLEIVMHHWAKYPVALAAVAAGAGFALSLIIPQFKPARPLLLFATLAMTLAPLAVAVLKQFSMRHCPWSLDLYGGYAQYIPLFAEYPGDAVPGHCFPAGHASTGFCLFTFHFLGRALGSAPFARAGFALGLFTGLGLGVVRIAQGAHFLSHVLWAGVVCWIAITLLYAFIIGPDSVPPAMTANPA